MAVVSILHRISGVLMVLLLPGLVYLLDLSLRSVEGFARVISLLDNDITRVVALIIAWSLSHHTLAGIRFMLIDFELGVERATARCIAWLVHAGALLLTALAAGALF
jgi:succinate dehydrogenase / fumarate reductase cytochrome b subunit